MAIAVVSSRLWGMSGVIGGGGMESLRVGKLNGTAAFSLFSRET